MKGCLTKDAAGNYFLVPPRGSRVQLNESAEIGQHVGQQVKISGSFVDADATDANSSSSNDLSAKESEKPHPIREFRVLKVDVLTPTCPAIGTAKKK